MFGQLSRTTSISRSFHIASVAQTIVTVNRMNRQAARTTTPSNIPKSSFGGKFLLSGWKNDVVGLIRVLDEFVVAGSELYMYSDVPLEKRRGLLFQVRN